MSKILNVALLCAAIAPATLATAAGAQQGAAPQPAQQAAEPGADAAAQAQMQAAMKSQAERQLYAGMVALRDYCKQADPKTAADIDLSWAKNAADIPKELLTFGSTPEFAAMVAARLKDMTAGSKDPAVAEKFKGACGQIIATK